MDGWWISSGKCICRREELQHTSSRTSASRCRHHNATGTSQEVPGLPLSSSALINDRSYCAILTCFLKQPVLFHRTVLCTASCVRRAEQSAFEAPSMLLFQLPEDVLYHILSYLDCKTLSRLSQVSKVICHIVSRDVVWKNIAKGLLNTGITRYWTDT